MIAMAWNDHTRDGVEARGKTEKVPDKCRTALSIALSHDRGDTWQRAGVVAGLYIRPPFQVNLLRPCVLVGNHSTYPYHTL